MWPTFIDHRNKNFPLCIENHPGAGVLEPSKNAQTHAMAEVVAVSRCVICQHGDGVVEHKAATFGCQCRDCRFHTECWTQFVDHQAAQEEPVQCPLCRRMAPGPVRAMARLTVLFGLRFRAELTGWTRAYSYLTLCLALVASGGVMAGVWLLDEQRLTPLQSGFAGLLTATYLHDASSTAYDLAQRTLYAVFFALELPKYQATYVAYWIFRTILRMALWLWAVLATTNGLVVQQTALALLLLDCLHIMTQSMMILSRLPSIEVQW